MDEQTRNNLEKSLAEEAMAHLRYLSYAERAEKETFSDVARVFRAMAAGERAHAILMLNELGIPDSDGTIEKALDAERDEAERKYPQLSAEADKAGEKGAQTIFNWTKAVEGEHVAFLELARENKLPDEQLFVCGVCGHLEAGTAPDVCPICSALNVFRLVQ